MALNYTDLFEDLGELVEAVNSFRAYASTLDTMAGEIYAELAGNARYDVLANIPELYEGYKDQMAGWASQIAAIATARLTHRDTVLDELPVVIGADVTTVLQELYRAMIDDGESVDASTVAIGAVTADVRKSDGTVLLTTVLDGVSAPVAYGVACPYYAEDLGNAVGSGRYAGEHADYVGTLSELSVASDPMALTCTADSETDGLAEGSELFSWVGELQGVGPYDWRTEGSGQGPSVGVLNGSGFLSNGEFETWTVTDTPDDWTVVTGTVGTHIEQSATAKRGSSALALTGDGSLAAIELTQAVSRLTPGKRYAVGCWVQGTTGTAAGTLTIAMKGTGYVPGTVEQISMDKDALSAQTTYGVEYFFFNAPWEIPDDFALSIKLAGTPSASKPVLIDGLALGEVVYHGGIGLAILAGDDPFLRGDRFTFTVTNDAAGIFQEFFRRQYGMQLPSNASGAETLADSLAE